MSFGLDIDINEIRKWCQKITLNARQNCLEDNKNDIFLECQQNEAGQIGFSYNLSKVLLPCLRNAVKANILQMPVLLQWIFEELIADIEELLAQ